MEDICIVCAEPLQFTAFAPCGHKDACSKCVSRLRSVLKDPRCVYCQVRRAAVAPLGGHAQSRCQRAAGVQRQQEEGRPVLVEPSSKRCADDCVRAAAHKRSDRALSPPAGPLRLGLRHPLPRGLHRKRAP